MADVFLSYARKDLRVAEAFAHALQEQGLSIWRDDHIAAGQHMPAALSDALDSSEVVVVLLSEASKDSTYVQAEAEHALAGKKVVIPVHIDQHSTRNFVWPLLADRTGFRLGGEEQLSDIAAQIAKIVRSNEGPTDSSAIGRSMLSRLTTAG